MKYADRGTEGRLVAAVKEAAARIDYNECKDPEGVLAECLHKQGLGEGFAKSATDALNKSYSVHYLSTHTDEDRDKDFPLLDSEKVKVRLAGESVPLTLKEKPCSAEGSITVTHMTMPKAASEEKKDRGRTEFKTTDEYLEFLTRAMSKAASAYDNFRIQTDLAYEQFHSMLKEASDHKDTHDQYTVEALYKQNIPAVTAVLNKIGHHQKEASAGDPMMGTAKKETTPVVPDNNTSREILGIVKSAFTVDFAQEESEFLQKTSSEMADCLKHLIDCRTSEVFSKHAKDDDDDDGLYKAVRGGVGAAAGLYGMPLVMGATAVGNLASLADQTAEQIESTKEPISYSRVLDADFIKEQKRMNDLEAWAEVAADPMLARYPIHELYPVTMKILSNYQNLSRPDATSRLIDYVAQAKSQGDRLGTAFHAAELKNLAELAKARGTSLGDSMAEAMRSRVQGAVDVTPYVSPMRAQESMFAELGSTIPKALEAGSTALGDAAKYLTDKITRDPAKEIQKQLTNESNRAKLEKIVQERENREKAKATKTMDAENRTKQHEADMRLAELAVRDRDIRALLGNKENAGVLRAAANADMDLVTDKRTRDVILSVPRLVLYPDVAKKVGEVPFLYDEARKHPEKYNDVLSRDDSDPLKMVFVSNPGKVIH